MECTVKKYRKFDCSTAHDAGIDGNILSLSTIVLNSRDWYEIIWLPKNFAL